MKASINSVRARLVVALTLTFAVLAFVAFYLQTQTLQHTVDVAHWGQRFSAAQLVKLYIDLSFPGEWQSRDGFLYKGSHRFIDGPALRSLLSDYLPPDTTICFEVGSPPAENRKISRPSEMFERLNLPLPLPPPTDPSRGGGMHRPDFPFATASGVGIAVRGKDSSVVGWIHVESRQDREALRMSRFRFFILFGTVGLYLAVLALFGALVLRLTRPVGKIAKAHERAKARNAELAC